MKKKSKQNVVNVEPKKVETNTIENLSFSVSNRTNKQFSVDENKQL